MENKNNYINALRNNRGQLNEMDLGEKIGLDDEETCSIIAQLLSEHRIEYRQHGACQYSLLKSR